MQSMPDPLDRTKAQAETDPIRRSKMDFNGRTYYLSFDKYMKKFDLDIWGRGEKAPVAVETDMALLKVSISEELFVSC